MTSKRKKGEHNDKKEYVKKEGGHTNNDASATQAGVETGNEPAGVEPAGVEPTGVEPAGVEPAGVEPAGNEPAGVEADGQPGGQAQLATIGGSPGVITALADEICPVAADSSSNAARIPETSTEETGTPGRVKEQKKDIIDRAWHAFTGWLASTN